MSVYTKTGDDGTTSLIGGKRVLKSDLQVETYGTVDELSSFIGLVILKLNDENKNQLTLVQKDLHSIMAYLAGGEMNTDLEGEIDKFEKVINETENKLTKITKFILPQGTEISCWLHILRTLCRKSERKIVGFFAKNNDIKKSKSIVKYFNRLSDFFFILARFYNKDCEKLI